MPAPGHGGPERPRGQRRRLLDDPRSMRVPGALLVAGAMTLLQSAAADSHRGRVFGA